MRGPRPILALAGIAAFLILGPASGADAEPGHWSQLSLMGGFQFLNRNDTALPGNFLNLPVAGSATYSLSRNLALEGEFSWLLPVRKYTNLGVLGTQYVRTPDILSLHASLLLRFPVGRSPWTPYLAGGAGAMSFLPHNGPRTYPQQLTTMPVPFAANFGVGTFYRWREHWSLRMEYREMAAFPKRTMEGLSNGEKANPLWTERAMLGFAYDL